MLSTQQNNQGDLLCANCQNVEAYWYVEESRGDYVCSGCGLCGDIRISSEGPDKRTFADSSSDHCHTEALDKYLGIVAAKTSIGSKGRTHSGNSKLANLHQQVQSGAYRSKETNLQTCLVRIREFVCQLESIGSVRNQAETICYQFYKENTKNKSVGEKKIDALALACIFLGSCKMALGVSSRTLALLTNVSESSINELITMIRKTLQPKQVVVGFTQSKAFIPQFCVTLLCKARIQTCALFIDDKISLHFDGRRSSTIAAACVLLACKRFPDEVGDFTLEDLALCADVSVETIEKTVDEILETLYLLKKQTLSVSGLENDCGEKMQKRAKTKASVKTSAGGDTDRTDKTDEAAAYLKMEDCILDMVCPGISVDHNIFG